MPTVNKQSLREQFDSLKAEFERLSGAGKMPAESRALFKALPMLFEVLTAVFMEKRTTKDSRNSNIPTSQTAKDETAITRPGRKAKGPSQNGAQSSNTRAVESVQVAPVDACDTCGADLRRMPSRPYERRTQRRPARATRTRYSKGAWSAGHCLPDSVL